SRRNAKGIRKKPHELGIGLSVDRRRGESNLQCLAMNASDLAAPGTWLHVQGERQRDVLALALLAAPGADGSSLSLEDQPGTEELHDEPLDPPYRQHQDQLRDNDEDERRKIERTSDGRDHAAYRREKAKRQRIEQTGERA